MFATTQRDPMLDLMHHLEHRIARTFNEPFRASEWPVPEAVTTAWLPLVDIFEEPDVIRLVAEVPGVRPSDVKITVESNLLTIKGTKEQLAEEKPIQGEIIAVGPGRLEKGQRVPMELKVGDRVVYGKYTGSQVELDEEEIILIKESDVIAKLS